MASTTSKIPAALDELLATLPTRERDIVRRRFGLGCSSKTLQEIGDTYGLTRERVRQLQLKSLERLQPVIEKHPIVNQLSLEAKSRLGKLRLKREASLLNDLLEVHALRPQDRGTLSFFLLMPQKLSNHPETDHWESFWGDSEKRLTTAKVVLKKIITILAKDPKRLWSGQDLLNFVESEVKRSLGVRPQAEELNDFICILKNLGKNPANQFGLTTHPHVSPSALGEKVEFVMSQRGQPMHFSEIHGHLSDLASTSDPQLSDRWRKRYSLQSIQNLLIMDKRFVWTGMGRYALKNWGYREGSILERMRQLLKKHKRLTKEELHDLLAKERAFSKITFEAYLRNHDHFVCTGDLVRLSK